MNNKEPKENIECLKKKDIKKEKKILTKYIF